MIIQKSFCCHPMCTNFYFIFKSLFVIKITIFYSCKYSSILTSVKIDVEIISNYPLNVIISLWIIPFFHFVTRMLYT